MFDITEGANMLTERSSIWLTVTALLIHCSAIKRRVMSWQFMAFMSSRTASKAAMLLHPRRRPHSPQTCAIRSKHLKWPCDTLALIRPRGSPAPLGAAEAIMWQRNSIIAQVFHRRHIGTPLSPRWRDSCEQAPNGRTSDNESGGTDWRWNYSVKSALKIRLCLMDGIVFVTPQFQ